MRTESIGSRIRSLRASRGWSIARLAREAELTESGIYKIEANPHAQPRADTLHALATALGVSADYLLAGEEDGAGSQGRIAHALPLDNIDLVRLPLLSRLIAGCKPADEGGWIDVPISFLPADVPRDALFVFEVVGDAEAGIAEVSGGDLLIAAVDADLSDGCAVLVDDGAHTVVCRAHMRNGEVWAVTAHQITRPIAERETVVARAIRVVKDL